MPDLDLQEKFLGTAFRACSTEDLERISKTDSFGEIEELTSPGRGYRVSGHDADGIGEAVVYGTEAREMDRDLDHPDFNAGGPDRSGFRRLNRIKRYRKGGFPRIKRYGHFGKRGV